MNWGGGVIRENENKAVPDRDQLRIKTDSCCTSKMTEGKIF